MPTDDEVLTVEEAMTAIEQLEISLDQANEISKTCGHYAGMARPIKGLQLNLAPQFHNEALLNAFKDKDAKEEVKLTLVNSWFSKKKNGRVTIYRDPEGNLKHCILGRNDTMTRFAIISDTFKAHKAWTLEAEEKAMAKLKSLVNSWQYRTYITSNIFVDFSERSGLTYIFRKQRPTIVLGKNDVLTTLCLHVMGHYDATWAGCLCPTDDVIAHWLLMRGDEPRLWRKANHIPIHTVNSGI